MCEPVIDLCSDDSNDCKELFTAAKKPKIDNNCSELEVIDTDKENIENDVQDDVFLKVLKEESLNASDNHGECTSAPSPSTSENESVPSTAAWNMPKELHEFIEKCRQTIKIPSIEKRIKTITVVARKASDYIGTDEFTEKFASITSNISTNKEAALAFVAVYNLFLSHRNCDESVRNLKLEKLYSKLETIEKIVNGLAEEEVDFDEEDNSSYMKLTKYQARAATILAHIRKLESKSVYYGISYFGRLDFNKSKYKEFNYALIKRYKNREKHTFPTFYDVNKCLRKCARDKGLNIPENELKNEVQMCFEELGKLLKKRRQKDLEFVHFAYLPNLHDPARDDPTLEAALSENRKIAKAKRQELFNRYVQMQESGVEPELSDDSDDSRRAESDEEEDVQEVAA